MDPLTDHSDAAPGAPDRRWYVTTAIPYVNARPHIGFALELALTDALARAHRLRGEDVRFLTGTDDNSLKNVQAAEREGITTRALVDRNTASFIALDEQLAITNDDFIRTSADPRHAAGVQRLWEACARNGDIYTKPYRGLYCVDCEQFYTEDELVDGRCPEHLTRPEVVEEQNSFFRLSRYAGRLEELIVTDRLRILPQSRKNEVLSFIRRGLEDFSVSRSQARARGWGIAVPGDPSQVMYVWFDALGNYISALDSAENGPLYRRYWAENPHRVHVIGKGILRFHAVYWPAMLLSAGLPLPTTIFVHGYITASGQKMGKSLGNAVDPSELIARYGADALRYYLLREIPATEDGDFTPERFARAYNGDLANDLGNLLNRVVSMVGRYCGGVVPAPVLAPAPTLAASGPTGTDEVADEATDAPLVAAGRALRERVEAAVDRYAPHEALAAIWEVVDAANRYVEASAPWVLAKRRTTGPEPEAAAASARLATVLYNLLEALRLIAVASAPFLPATAQALAAQLNLPLTTGAANGEGEGDESWARTLTWGGYPTGTKLRPGDVLFPRIEEETAERREEAGV